MELAHLPYRKGTYEDYVGLRGLKKRGKKKWRKHVADVVDRLTAALEPDDVVLGGGNVKQLKELPPGCRRATTPTRSSAAFGCGRRRGTARPPSRKETRMTEGIDPLTSRRGMEGPPEPTIRRCAILHLRKLFADDPKRGERLTAEAAGIYLDYSKNRITDETLDAPPPTGGGVRPARADRRHVPRREDQRHGEPGRPARGPARAPGGLDRRGRRERGAPGPRRARQDGRLLQPRAERRLEGPHRQAHPQRRSTSASAAPTSAR